MEIPKFIKSIKEPAIEPKPMEEQTLDPLTKAEIETRIAAIFPPERRAKLFEQEGVKPKDYLNLSIRRRLKEFLGL